MVKQTSDQQIDLSDWSELYRALDLDMFAKYSEFMKANEAVITTSKKFWTIPVIEGVDCVKIIHTFDKLGVCIQDFYIDELDDSLLVNERDPNKTGSYFVSFNRNKEIDQSFCFLSTDALIRERVNAITVPERLLLGLQFFMITGEHLDTEGATFCMGSRFYDGDIPIIGYGGEFKGLYMDWLAPECSRKKTIQPRVAINRSLNIAQ